MTVTDQRLAEYDAATLDSLYAEHEQTDRAEQAIAAALVTLLLWSRGVVRVDRVALKTALAPVLTPIAFSAAFALLSRSSRGYDDRDWPGIVDGAIDRAIDRIANAVESRAEEIGSPTVAPTAEPLPAPTAPEWAKKIAQTIVNGVVEGAKEAIAPGLGFEAKRWLTRLDSRVRPSHLALEAVTVPADEKFKTPGGVELDRPGDPNAPLQETINCRCLLLWLKAPEELPSVQDVEAA